MAAIAQSARALFLRIRDRRPEHNHRHGPRRLGHDSRSFPFVRDGFGHRILAPRVACSVSGAECNWHAGKVTGQAEVSAYAATLLGADAKTAAMLSKPLEPENFRPYWRLYQAPSAIQDIAQGLASRRNQARQLGLGHALQHDAGSGDE